MTSTIDFYSQNFEDVFLARCFPGRTDGFYIDVGAQDEEADSVTRHFYEAGWSGINIEPVAEFAETFRRRERDQTVCCAAGSEESLLPMAISLDSGLSSFDQTNAAQTERMGLLAGTRMIQVRRLDDILHDLGLSEKRFEFLKVDVEGFELEVIKGIDLRRYRPRIILCEATEPNTSTKTASFEELCGTIEACGYAKLFFDGLNQWWCEQEVRHELAQHFLVPPGVMDSLTITPYSGTWARKQLREVQAQLKTAADVQHQLTEQIGELHHQISDLHQSLQTAHHQLREASQARQQAVQQIEALRASDSWKLTQPLRQMSHVLNRLWKRP